MSGRFVHVPRPVPIYAMHTCAQPRIYSCPPSIPADSLEEAFLRPSTVRVLPAGTLWRCACGRLWIAHLDGWGPAGRLQRWLWRKHGWPLTSR